jgi:peptide/nickel transport system substrate-binding protein
MARYQAVIDWFDQYDLMVISNGPYKLVDFDTAAQYAELEAFRDSSYPFKPGDWYYGSSPALEISNVTDTTVTRGQAASIGVTLSGPGNLGVDYLLYDPSSNAILTTGQAASSSTTNFSIPLSAQLTTAMDADIYHLYILANSDSLSSLAEQRVDIEVSSGTNGGTTPDNGGTTPDNGGTTPDNGGGSISPIVIIIPIVLLAGGGIVYFILRGGRTKKTG